MKIPFANHTLILRTTFFVLLVFINSCSSDSELFDILDNHQTTEKDLESQEDLIDGPEASYYGENIFYVTVDGNENNDGKTADTAWEISYAFQMAKAGDIIYVKAGNYGSLSLLVGQEGTVQEPIQFIGYKNSPEDIVSVDGASISYEEYKENGDAFDPLEMPTLVGDRIDDIGYGVGLKLTGKQHIQISNFQISRYQHNLLAYYCDNLKLTNIVLSDSGDFNLANTDSAALGGTIGLNQTGEGISIYNSNYVEVRNCISINDGMRGIMLTESNYSKNYNSKIYSDNDINSCDYYYLLYNSDFGLLENIYVERVGQLQHEGHGICLKDGASDNILRNCYVNNTMIELSFNNVYDNLIENCYIDGGFKEGEIRIANGAHHNTFYRVTVNGGEGGVTFCDWFENGLTNAGHDNEFVECTFSNNKFGVGFYHWSLGNTEAYNNIFNNCTFNNSPFLFQVDRPNRDNLFKNCIFENIPGYMHWAYPQSENLTVNAIFEDNIYNNTGF
ncbi:right-handed parallel beta-helix repeat-containing protein [Maribacter sp. CXY002]|uniref:right-handed parallel beta-helix repeat-containing protein n=1 Tax=Maribacter luteocoastalis TaxID=3407671 RepID=UPI003B6852CD